MSEKRFKLDDGLIWDNGKEMDDVVGVLNAFEEENIQLKLTLNEIMESILQNDCFRDIMKKAIKELQDELDIEEMI